jgi:hypothetical protein
MGKEHFHLLLLTARSLVFRRRGNTPRFVMRSLMDAASDLAEWRIRTAAILHRTALVVDLACPIDDRVSLRDARARICRLDLSREKWAGRITVMLRSDYIFVIVHTHRASLPRLKALRMLNQ